MAAIVKPSSPVTPTTPASADEFGEVIRLSSSGEAVNYTVHNPLEPISGFTDYSLREMVVFQAWKTKLAHIYALNGFVPFELRPVEYAQNLLKGGLGKQVFGISRLQDGSLTKLGLPFDRTVPAAIFVAHNRHTLTFPLARSDINLSWRGEKATTGRKRAFYQADIDIFDRVLTARTDAQCIVTLIQGVEALTAQSCVLRVNHIGIARFFISKSGVQEKDFANALRIVDKLKPDNRPAVMAELVETLPSFSRAAADSLLDRMKYCGPIKDYQFPIPPTPEATEALKHLQEIEQIATLLGIRPGMIQFAAGLVRGLDYYTGVVFETFMTGRERYGSIASGGRYSDLVGDFARKKKSAGKADKIEGVGGSIGLTRLFEIMSLEGILNLDKQTSAHVLVGFRTMGEGCFPLAVQLAGALRLRNINVELYSGAQVKVGKQLDLCNDKGIPFAAIVMNQDEIILKNMTEASQEDFRTIKAIAAKLEALRDRGMFSHSSLTPIRRVVATYLQCPEKVLNVVMSYF